MRRQILGLIGLVVVVSCQDSSPGGRSPLAPSQGASFYISDGRVTGCGTTDPFCNPETFWGTPLAQNAKPGDANFDIGAAHALLQPYLRVCVTDGTPGLAGCTSDVTGDVTGSPTGLLMTYGSGTENYTTSLQTKKLDKTLEYRLEVWGVAFTAAEKAALDPRWLFTKRDIDNSPSVSACTFTQAFCFIKYGQTIPVKVRIEQFVFCPVARNCGMQFVSTGTDATLEATLNTSLSALTSGPPTTAQFHIPAQAGTNFAIAFEPCTDAEDLQVSDLFDIITGGPCLKTVSKFTGTLGTPAIISFCDANNAPPNLTAYGFPASQQSQVVLHHISLNVNPAQIQALPEAWDCDTPTSGQTASANSNWLLHYARAFGDHIRSWAAPKPLYATATMMIDRGGGGEDPFIGSFFKLALPAKFEYVDPADAFQEDNAGDAVPVRAKVTDLFGAPIQGVKVHWLAVLTGTDGATVEGTIPAGPILTGADGIAHNTATLFADYRGTNVFYAFGRGIADNREAGCNIPPSTSGLAMCNGPRQTPSPFAYDPFIPLHAGPPHNDTGTESPVHVPVGTRLRFEIFGRGSSPP